MSGLGDEVVARCASCGYALTARRYAVPRDCPICRAQLDPDSAATPQDADGEYGAHQHTDAPREAAPTFTPETTSMSAPETDSTRTPEHARPQDAEREPEAQAAHVPPAPPQSASYAPPQSTPPATPSSNSHAPSPSVTPPLFSPAPQAPTHARPLNESSPSLGEVTNVTPPASGTSPLDAGQLWSEFGEETPRTPQPASAAHAPRAEPKTEAAPEPSRPAPPPAQPPNSFPQSSMLGLSGGPDAQRHAQTRAQQPHEAPAPFSTPNAAPARVQPLQANSPRGAFEASVAPNIMSRYRDGYRYARVFVSVGSLIKVLGALLGVLTGLCMFWLTKNVAGGVEAGLVLGILVAFVIAAVAFVFGVVVSAYGQLKKADLDSAVNSSPFLTNEERAEVMSLH